MIRPAPRIGVLLIATALLGLQTLSAQAPHSPPPFGEPMESQPAAGQPETVEEGYLPGAGGLPLFYRIVGYSGPVVVAVHGGPGAGMNAFYANLVPLAEDHRVIFYDQRGGGRSALPEDEDLLDASWFVRDLEAVREHFGLERMKLVAHSFGAVLVARYAQKHPERVERLALLKATGPKRSEAAPKRDDPEGTDTRRLLGEALRPLLEGTAEDPVAACRRYEALGEELSRVSGQPSGWRGSTCDAPPEAVAYYYSRTAQITPRSFGDWNFTETLGAVSAPVLVISGDEAGVLVKSQRAWAEAYPQGRLLGVPGAGSAPVASHPGQVFAALETFFGGDWPEGAEPPEREKAETDALPAGELDGRAHPRPPRRSGRLAPLSHERSDYGRQPSRLA